MKTKDIADWRLILGMTQGQLAESLGVTIRTVNNWENSRTPVPPWLEFALIGLSVKLEEKALETTN